MDHLSTAILNLTPRERTVLLKEIKHQKKKHRLFELLKENGELEIAALNKLLDYEPDNYTNLYTLKNRLFDDIINVKLELIQNNLVITKQKVQSLRSLVYSKDKVSLLRELKKQEKNALSLELFGELTEIYFCLFLTYRHDDKRSAEYLQLVRDYKARQGLQFEIEEIFYSKLLDTQDLFYFHQEHEYESGLEYLAKVEKLHQQLNTRCSAFIWLSADLTLKLSNNDELEDPNEMEAKLEELAQLYYHSFLIYRYPNCDIAIKCLFSKFYFLTDRSAEFRQTQDYIYKKLSKVQGYQMFDCCFFYFVYVSLLVNARKGSLMKSTVLLQEAAGEDKVMANDDKMRMYHHYLIAIRKFYAGRYRMCLRSLTQSRQYFKALDRRSSWVAVDNILLNILIHLIRKDLDLIESEVHLLKRKIKKYDLDPKVAREFRDMMQMIRKYEQEEDPEIVVNYFKRLQENIGVLRLIIIDKVKPLQTEQSYLV
ncbi:MAG: hypothetical protein ACFB10_16260 [Salibacteraceae bacterium]